MKLSSAKILAEAQSILRQALEKVPGLSVEAETQLFPNAGRMQADAELTLSYQGERWTLVLEAKVAGHPKLFRQAAALLKDRQAVGTGRTYGILAAPYVSAEGARECEAQGLGYLDLCGNLRLAFGPIYIEQGGRPNRFSEKRQLKGLFSPKASLVLRTLLDNELGQPWRGRTWKIKELAEASEVSLGQAFAVARLLEAQDWAEGRRGRFQLTQPRKLLQAWAADYKAPVARSFSFYTGKDLDYFEKQAGIVAELLYKDRFAQASFSAAARYAPNVRRVRSTLYLLGKVDALVARLQAEETLLKPVDSGPNVLILEPEDERVFVRAQRPWDVPATSPVQTYLDLMQESLRGPEAAEALLDKISEKRVADLGLDQQLVDAAKAVMLELHRLLGEYAEDMALVGGWVPPLLLPDAPESHVGSEDVDVVMNHRRVNEEAYGRVVAILEKAGYYQKDKGNPFQYFRDVTPPGAAAPISVQVDFLAGEYAGSGRSRRHQEFQELKARKARGADLVFEEDVRIHLEGRLPNGDRDSVDLRIAGVTAFLTMKAEALKGRQKDKDAYDLYFCLKHYPGGLDAVLKAMAPLARHGLVQEALAVLAEKFETPEHWAAGAVARAYKAQGEDEAMLRRDVVERVALLVQGLKGA